MFGVGAGIAEQMNGHLIKYLRQTGQDGKLRPRLTTERFQENKPPTHLLNALGTNVQNAHDAGVEMCYVQFLKQRVAAGKPV